MYWTISLATQMMTCWDSAVFHIGLSKLKSCILLLSAFHPVFLGMWHSGMRTSVLFLKKLMFLLCFIVIYCYSEC